MSIYNISLTKRYIPAVSLIAIFIIVTNILNTNSIRSNKEYGKIINISGKQRMMSQKLVILGLNFIANKNQQSQKELEDIISEISSSHKYLLTKIFTKELSDIYYTQNLDKELTIYIDNFKRLISSKDDTYLHRARKTSNIILKKLDKAVKEYERFANSQLEITSNYELYLMFITLFILLMEVLFIFKPAAKKIEEDKIEIEDKEEYERTVIESNYNAIIAIDWTSKITTYNKKAQEMFGWTKEEMIGTRNLLRIIPSKYKQAHIKASDKYLETGKSCGFLGSERELEAQRKDGSTFAISISFGSKYKVNRSIIIANISDITSKIEIKKQNQLLQQQSRLAAMGEMIGNIAHQWRQPLNAISATSIKISLLSNMGMLENSKVQESSEFIQDQTQKMSTTIDTFMNYVKPSKEYKQFKLSHAIEAIMQIMGIQLSNHNIKVNIEIVDDISIQGHENLLEQVLINILSNARDALNDLEIENKFINIAVDAIENIPTIKIEDNAGGIPQSIRDKIFNPYFSTKEQGKGTGIGLYMSMNIMKKSFNGDLIHKNTKNGSCFEIICKNGAIGEI